ncbi:tetratricopeptide repeat protein [Yoonia sp. 2307UL14-13]|uniref:tetratricopeptide repeat protein n=1 Tax=Yoonia sp. 2307UL14-13 TaxID=3126506 RepID=UPI0030ABF82E
MADDAQSNEYGQADIDQYLEHVLRAGVFEQDSRLHKLLVHVLEQEMAGDGASLKAYAIGLDVFDKTPDFDPSTDSGVRVAAGRLRTALKLFENSEHANTRLQVALPVGTYRPSITVRAAGGDRSSSDMTIVPSDTKPPKNRRTTLILSAILIIGTMAAILGYQRFATGDAPKRSVDLNVASFGGDPELASTANTALRRALSRSRAIAVLPSNADRGAVANADFRIDGTANRLANDRARLTIELTSQNGNRVVWATSMDVDISEQLQESVAQTLGSELRVRVFGASKEELAGQDPETLTAEQLFIMATWVPGPAINSVDWELERIRLMQIALEKDPAFGAAHSVMADKLSYLANVYGPSNSQEKSDAAVAHARTAMELAPLNADVMFNVAQAFWHSGMVGESTAAMRRVVELDPSHDLARFLARVVPYTCAEPPDTTIAWAENFDSRLSADNPIRWLTLTWVAWLHANQGDYEEALQWEERAALVFEIPYTFMRHAMILNELGRTQDAANLIQAQRRNWPDIEPQHFADVTYPRLCSEAAQPGDFVARYERLATELSDEL